MAGLLNSYKLAPAAGGLQYVGGHIFDLSAYGSASRSIDLAGMLTGGIASSPQAGDFCIVNYSLGGTANRAGRSIANAIGEFTTLLSDYANSTNDTSVTIKYKFLESPIDTVLIMGDDGSSSVGVALNVQVFRGVNVTTPFDVTEVNTNTTTGRPDPGSITPTTAGALIGCFAGAAVPGGTTTQNTSAAYDLFDAVCYSGPSRGHCASFGLKAWVSGAFNAAQYGGGTATGTDTNITCTFALRPA